jgi:2-polyprenyl-6-methoxyphenol hydroxylase-like FAD-dependent oxidoreductase
LPLFSRDLLTAYLINEAQERYPGQINFHFETQLESLSLQGKTASFKAVANGQTQKVDFDLIIGADGASSR